MVIVSRSHGSPVALFRIPPHRSITLRPWWYTQHATPSSPRRMKFSVNASRTSSNPSLTSPNTGTDCVSDIVLLPVVTQGSPHLTYRAQGSCLRWRLCPFDETGENANDRE